MASRTAASAPTPKLPEPNKYPGVCYAVTRDGVELPVVDVTHPAFAISISDAEQKAQVEKFLRQGIPLAMLPERLRELILRFLLRESILAQGVQQARSTFMSGMHTYLLKLGPEMLGSAYTKAIDHQIAAALPSFCVRLRLQDTAQLLADTLLPLLRSNPNRPLRLINIAGGPAMDSLHALILLNPATAGHSEPTPHIDRCIGSGRNRPCIWSGSWGRPLFARRSVARLSYHALPRSLRLDTSGGTPQVIGRSAF